MFSDLRNNKRLTQNTHFLAEMLKHGQFNHGSRIKVKGPIFGILGPAKKKLHVVLLKVLGLPHQEIVRIARASGGSVTRYLISQF